MTPAEIAASLSPQHRAAINNCRQDENGGLWLAAHSTILRALWKKGLATYHARPSRLTPLGEQVRRHLLGEQP